MRMPLLAFILIAHAALPVSAQVVGVFPSTVETPTDLSAVATFEMAPGEVVCNMTAPPVDATPDNPPYLILETDTESCVVGIAGIVLSLPEGLWRLAAKRTPLSEWGPLTAIPFRRVASSKVCYDGSTRYQQGSGPAVERWPNDTIAKRAAWLERDRALVRAGFDVKALLVSTSVYFAVTCR